MLLLELLATSLPLLAEALLVLPLLLPFSLPDNGLLQRISLAFIFVAAFILITLEPRASSPLRLFPLVMKVTRSRAAMLMLWWVRLCLPTITVAVAVAVAKPCYCVV